MIYRHRKIILLLIVVLGFCLRFYAANSFPINEDEWKDFKSIESISFDPDNIKLPLVDKRRDSSPIAFTYLLKIGWEIFGRSLLGARLPFVILGALTVLMVYFLASLALEARVALLAAFLLAINQFAIGTTMFADLNAVISFFSVCSLFVFYKGLKNGDWRLILLNGVIVGIGCWFKENIFLLIPIYIVFLLLFRKWYYRRVEDKYLWGSLFLAFLFIIPYVYITFASGGDRFEYIQHTVQIKPSPGPVTLYLGELILLFFKPFPDFFSRVAITLNTEFPLTNFVLGLLVIIAVFKAVKSKKTFIKLLAVCFVFEFIFFSFIRNEKISRGFWNLETFYYNIMGFIPGIILASEMLVNFARPYKKYYRKTIVALFLVFAISRSFNFVFYPLYCYFPRKDLCIKRLLNFKGGCLKNKDIPKYIKKDIFKKIYKLTDHGSFHKKKAAFILAHILFKEARYRESKKYLYYILAQDFQDKEALILLDRIKHKIRDAHN
jgi:hypothetical protein